jgi:hypothetical protein
MMLCSAHACKGYGAAAMAVDYGFSSSSELPGTTVPPIVGVDGLSSVEVNIAAC